MLTVLVVAVLAALAGLASGGSLQSLAETRARALWLVYAGLIIQVAAIVFSPEWLSGIVLLVASTGCIAVFLTINMRLPGMAVAGAGLLLNMIVIGANGAMPVSMAAVEDAGIERSLESPEVKHEPMDDDTVLPWLGDVLPIPVVREIWSLGDVFLAAGIGYFVFRRTTANRTGRHAATG